MATITPLDATLGAEIVGIDLARMSEADWTPQYSYWKRPAKLDDGGANLPD